VVTSVKTRTAALNGAHAARWADHRIVSPYFPVIGCAFQMKFFHLMRTVSPTSK